MLIDTEAELFDLAVRSGLQVLDAMLEEDRTAICGPRYAHQADRTASRAGTVASTVVLGGRKVSIRRPRVRSGRQEVPLPTFQTMAQTDPLRRRTVEQLLVGVSTRGYARSLEPLPADIPSRSVSKSAVSRRFVAKTASQLAAWQATPLDELDLAGLLLDGVHIGEHCVVVALGIGVDGTKHALGLWEGSTENATVCQSLLANLQSRGLRTDRSILVMLDGSKALRAAVTAVFGRAALVQRCQIHKTRNILDHLPERQRSWVLATLKRAYQSKDVKTATRLLRHLARRLDQEHPCAAASVREGLEETLTVLTLGLSPRLQRSLATTNAVESLISRTRHVKRNVKRWRGGQMMLRWVAAGVLEAAKGFRRLKGHADMPQLVAALRARDQRLGYRRHYGGGAGRVECHPSRRRIPTAAGTSPDTSQLDAISSAMSGERPALLICPNLQKELELVAREIKYLTSRLGFSPAQICCVSRSALIRDQLLTHLVSAGLNAIHYRADGVGDDDAVLVSTLHSTKGHEFRSVFILGLFEGALPLYSAAEVEEIEREAALLLRRHDSRQGVTLSFIFNLRSA